MSTTTSEETESAEVRSGVGGALERILDQLHENAGVRSVYGEPIEVGEKTILPVARIGYGFGGGFGISEDDDEEGGQGGGGGGGVSATPIGVVEITADETHFVRFGDRKRLAAAAFAGVLVGVLLTRRART